MSLYRQATGLRSRALAAAALAALVAGAIAGFAIGRSTAGEPTLAALASEARGRLSPAVQALELVTIEYPESVRNGRVVAPTEYDAALAQARTAADVVVAGRPALNALDPAAAARAEELTAGVVRLVEAEAEPARVKDAVRLATAALERLGAEGGSSPAGSRS